MKTAWFLTHRIREAMRDGSLAPMGGDGKTVEIDETFACKIEDAPKGRKPAGSAFRSIALTLVERGGPARSFHVENTSLAVIIPIIRANIASETAIMTDKANWYKNLSRYFSDHRAVDHRREEYVRYEGEIVVTTNTVEGFYGVFKRGMRGVYQHCSERHLHRYLAEFDFRYSNRTRLGVNDTARADRALLGVKGKRLTYRTTGH